MKFTNYCSAIVIVFTVVSLPFSASAQDAPKVIHAFVALCDNEYQGIVPVRPALGNGDDPRNNLYWGALYGVKSFFKRSPNWDLIDTSQPGSVILERCIFKHKRSNVYLVADAYRGREIKQAIIDFLNAASGTARTPIAIDAENHTAKLRAHGDSKLTIYVGHDGLMDFELAAYPATKDDRTRETMILACISKTYFRDAILAAGATPLVWTTGLMAPEAYTIENAVEGWILGEDAEGVRLRAAQAYNQFQKCGMRGANRLFVTGL
jgi:hypothetical protein